VWERKDLERHSSSSPSLLARYKLSADAAPASFHPAHQQYVVSLDLNTLDYFFEIADTLDGQMRDEVFSFAFHAVVNPRFRSPKSDTETLGDLMLDRVDYASFRTRCYELSRARLAEHLLVQAIIVHTLGWAQRFGDPTRVEAAIERNQGAIDFCLAELETESDVLKREALNRMVESQKALIETAPDRQRTWAEYYRVLCESVLPRLALEADMRMGFRTSPDNRF
jgi:hypothetical protein